MEMGSEEKIRGCPELTFMSTRLQFFPRSLRCNCIYSVLFALPHSGRVAIFIEIDQNPKWNNCKERPCIGFFLVKNVIIEILK